MGGSDCAVLRRGERDDGRHDDAELLQRQIARVTESTRRQREFVGAIFNYCTFSWQGLCKYAFDLFDEDGSGPIDVHELGDLAKELAV